MSEIRLPIKVVVPQDHDYKPDTGGGGPRKIFGEVTEEFRQDLASQVDEVEEYFRSSFIVDNLPAVARVRLRTEALAKSHRPSYLLNQATCPIIGVQDFGEILVSVSPQRLQALQERILSNRSSVKRLRQ